LSDLYYSLLGIRLPKLKTYVMAQYPRKFIGDVLNLNQEQVNAALVYILDCIILMILLYLKFCKLLQYLCFSH
jgi:cobalamin biosynthesis protein CobD/CbiB